MKKWFVVLALLVVCVAAFALETVIPVDDSGSYVGPGKLRQYQVTATDDAIDATFTPSRDISILSVRFNAEEAAPAAKMFKLQIDSATDAAYDIFFLNEDVNGVDDLIISYDPPLHVVRGDLVLVDLEAFTSVRGIEIIYCNRG